MEAFDKIFEGLEGSSGDSEGSAQASFSLPNQGIQPQNNSPLYALPGFQRIEGNFGDGSDHFHFLDTVPDGTKGFVGHISFDAIFKNRCNYVDTYVDKILSSSEKRGVILQTQAMQLPGAHPIEDSLYHIQVGIFIPSRHPANTVGYEFQFVGGKSKLFAALPYEERELVEAVHSFGAAAILELSGKQGPLDYAAVLNIVEECKEILRDNGVEFSCT